METYTETEKEREMGGVGGGGDLALNKKEWHVNGICRRKQTEMLAWQLIFSE